MIKSKEVSMVVYPSVDTEEDGFNRVSYKDYVIQIIAQNDTVWNCVINPDCDDVVYETKCLLDAVKWIDKDINKRSKEKTQS